MLVVFQIIEFLHVSFFQTVVHSILQTVYACLFKCAYDVWFICCRCLTSHNNLELVRTNFGEMRERRRKKMQRVASLFVATVMGMIADYYYRKRPRHLMDPSEMIEREREM